MILWILAIILLGTLGLIGYYQGAIRVAFSLVGLILAAFLAMPLSGAIKPILRLVGVDHPVTLSFIAPAVIYLLILIIFKSAALAVHKKIDTYYKYKVSDTERMLYERLTQRLGVCLGLANATVYVILLAVIGYVLGYFTVQVSTAENSAFSVKIANQVAEDLQTTKMGKAVASFVPATETYYDAVDILGDLYHNPLLQSRLSSYPPFLSLAENAQFSALAKDTAFQEKLWLKQPRPRLGELLDNEKLNPMVHDVDLFTNIMGMMHYDLKDLKHYVETGKSPKFDDEKLLGHWYYDFASSFKRARRAKPLMAPLEIKKVRSTLAAMTNAVLTAYVDNRIILKVPPTNNAPPITVQGTWKSQGTEKYEFNLKEGGKNLEAASSLEGSKLVVRKGNFALVFER